MKKYIFLILFFSTTSQAAFFDLNLGLLQGGVTTTSDSKTSRSFTSLGLFAHLGKTEARSGFLLGWNITSVGVNDEFNATNSSQKVNSSDMGPAIRWFYDKEIIYSATLFYGVICKGTYQTATVDEKITGSSLNIKLAAETKINDNVLIGFAINNYSASYTEAVSNSVHSDVSYKNTWLYPSLSLAFQF